MKPQLPDSLSSNLDTLGKSFESAIRWAYEQERGKKSKTKAWTEFVLDWWSAAAATQSLSIDCRRRRPHKESWLKHWGIKSRPFELSNNRDDSHEFLVDLLISNYPSFKKLNNFYTEEHWNNVLKDKRRFVVALESEFGTNNSYKKNRALVLEDAVKLTHVRADLKVFVFGVHKNDRVDTLVTDIKRLRENGEDKASWLLFPVPWAEPRPDEIRHRLIRASNRSDF